MATRTTNKDDGYELFVNELMREQDGTPSLVQIPDHVSLQVRTLFSYAKREVLVMWDTVDDQIFRNTGVADAAARFLRTKPHGTMKILTERAASPKNSVFLRAVLRENVAERIAFRLIAGANPTAVDGLFIVTDQRFLLYRESRARLDAVVSFGDTNEAAEMAANFKTIWDDGVTVDLRLP